MSKLEQAIKAARAGISERALVMYGEVIADSATECAEALGHRAWLLRSLGRFDDARADYEALIARQPGNMEAETLRVEMIWRAGNLEDALDALTRLLQRHPRNRSAARLLLQIQDSLGDAAVPPAPPPSHDTALPKQPINTIIQILESDPASYRGSAFPEIGRFLYSFVRLLRPRNVAEIGVLYGYTTLCLAQALKENGGGHLHSFDLFSVDHQPLGYKSPVPGVAGDPLQIAWGHIEKAGLSGCVTLHKGDSSSTIRKTFPGTSAVFDFAFIDGDHRLKGCLNDWQAIDERLAEGGIVMLHDTMPDESSWMGPRHLLVELEKRAPGLYHSIDLPTPEGYGIGFVQKRTAAAAEKWKIALKDQAAELLFKMRKPVKR